MEFLEVIGELLIFDHFSGRPDYKKVFNTKSRSITLSESMKRLTERQSLILQMIAEGRTNTDIADLLAYSESLIRQETIKIYSILSCSGRLEAARLFKEYDKENALTASSGKRGA